MSPHRSLNPASVMLARLVYLLHLGCGGYGLAQAFGAAATQSPGALVEAAAWLRLSVMFAVWLRRVRRYAECRDGFGALGSFDGPTDDETLARLRHDHAELERLRGTPGFDPWAALALRREIERRSGGRVAPPDPRREP